jgi:D-galactarolactone cycloisomerase
MVDVLFSLDLPEAKRLARALVPFDLHFLEAPTRREDLLGWAELRALTGIALAGPELESSLSVLRDTLSIRAVDYLQVDATICGGITQMRRAASLAAAYHKQTSIHCSGSAIGFAANAQAAAAFAGCDGIEMHTMHRSLFDKLWEGGYRIEGGAVVLPDGPGLGIEIAADDPSLRKV